MRTEKLKGELTLDLKLANSQWSVRQWENWAWRNNVGIIIENGRVSGWDIKEKRFHE